MEPLDLVQTLVLVLASMLTLGLDDLPKVLNVIDLAMELNLLLFLCTCRLI